MIGAGPGAALRFVRDAWRRVPASWRRRVGQAINWTGLPYVAGYAAAYEDAHRAEYFAGNLKDLKETYARVGPPDAVRLTRRIDAIADGLVMRNGVKKTTYAARQAPTLRAVLSATRVPLPSGPLRVLDVPSSTGTASLDHYALLQEHREITSYVLGDLYHGLLYDARRGCVFDEDGHLLQVALRGSYFSIYRGFTAGDRNTLLSDLLLLPHGLTAWYLRRRYPFDSTHRCEPLLVLHPEVERRIGDGVFQVARMDVFRPIPGRYNLILSFNLLQRNYFSPSTIARGVANLGAALDEGGLLVLGSTESFVVLHKCGGVLQEVLRDGCF